MQGDFIFSSSHSQACSIPNNGLGISLQNLKIKGRDEFDFLHKDKHETLLQVDDSKFGGYDHSCPKYSE